MLYMVFGGELADLDKNEFRDLKAVEFVGVYGDYKDAIKAWRGRAQATVDIAVMRFFILPFDPIKLSGWNL